MASNLGVDTWLPEAVQKTNDSIPERLALQIGEFGVAAVLGATYKENTPVVEESGAVRLIRALDGRGKVKVYDPMGLNASTRRLLPNAYFAASTAECLRGADLCIVATPWPEFRALTPEDFKVMRRLDVLDCWRVLDKCKSEPWYRAVGVNGS
jgi:UDPglucose 6-dehydrogenase